MDPARGCPGRDRSSWGPDDIFEVPCDSCGTAVEFFRDDVRRYCSSCGACVPNPRRAVSCVDWCAAAERCSTGRSLLGG